jgi:hypothetical protein
MQLGDYRLGSWAVGQLDYLEREGGCDLKLEPFERKLVFFLIPKSLTTFV